MKTKCVVNNNKLILLLLEEEYEIAKLFSYTIPKIRKKKNVFFENRESEGFCEILRHRYLSQNETKFRELFRINPEQFDFILSLVEEELTKQPTRIVKQPISASEKLAVTLRYLATGESNRSLSTAFRISHGNISKIIRKTLAALRSKLMPLFMPNPNTIDYKAKAAEFYRKWNFPNCILAIDAKHIRRRSPNNSGSSLHDYKDYYSTVLLALVDANYKFITLDIGSYGIEGDSGIFKKSNMGKKILNGSFDFPDDCTLPGSDIVVPHVIVGDEVFRLHKHIMKPYSKQSSKEDNAERVFNSRLRRASRVTENAFGLLSQVFRVFYEPIKIEATTCDDLIWVACCLHNMLRDGYLEKGKCPFYAYDKEQPAPLNSMKPIAGIGGFANANGFEIRERFKLFFNGKGAVPLGSSENI